jgi:isopropylmalate/homocitrate/citramalate synthase
MVRLNTAVWSHNKHRKNRVFWKVNALSTESSVGVFRENEKQAYKLRSYFSRFWLYANWQKTIKALRFATKSCYMRIFSASVPISIFVFMAIRPIHRRQNIKETKCNKESYIHRIISLRIILKFRGPVLLNINHR